MISLFFNGHNEGIKEDVVIQDTVEIYFQFPGVNHTLSRYPDNIIMGLAKLGGLFAALKVSLVLLAINKSLFEKKMSSDEKLIKEQQEEGNSSDFKEFQLNNVQLKYSIENFDKLLHNVQLQQQKIIRQENMIELLM